MADDWDLHAVVRGCCSGSAATSSSSASASAAAAIADDPFHFLIPDPFEPRRSNHIEDLQDLFKPFVPKLKPLLPISPFSVLGRLKDLSPPHAAVIPHPPPQLQPKQQQQQKQYVSVSGASANVTPRSKRRKTQMKKVCQVAAEDLSSDTWSWRKYGQKPIKGSPYPRGYYKCSTSKGCLARKQVERNRSDPGMFIVTYTADHNHPMPTHRNSLAGSTRQKPETLAAVESNKPSCSSPATLSPATTERRENREEREDFLEVDEEDEFGVSDMAISDDFFEGLEEFTGSDNGDCFSDHRPASLTASWLGNSAATAAGGDG